MKLDSFDKQAIIVAVHHLGFVLSLHEVATDESISKDILALKPKLEKEMGKISENMYCAQVRRGFALLNLLNCR